MTQKMLNDKEILQIFNLGIPYGSEDELE